MAFAAKDNCPESSWNDWSYWNEDKKKWKFEKSSLMAICKREPPASLNNLKSEAGNNGSTVENGRMVTKSTSTSTCLQLSV